tara:strand:+ start:1162 stop:1356 length:195 start_codon:yes stop_codon:yes gene_type:complete
MNSNENILLKDSEPSIKFIPETGMESKMEPPSTMVDNLPKEPASEAPDNFESLTYVSSRGFFFH